MKRKFFSLSIIYLVTGVSLSTLAYFHFQENKTKNEALMNSPRTGKSLSTPAELWLKEHASKATRMTVSYGSTLPASIQKKVVMTDRKCILLTLSALRCKGDLTEPTGALFDESSSYKGIYGIKLDFEKAKSESISISPYGGPELGSGLHYTIMRSDSHNLLGYATTDAENFQVFSKYLNSCQAVRKVWRNP